MISWAAILSSTKRARLVRAEAEVADDPAEVADAAASEAAVAGRAAEVAGDRAEAAGVAAEVAAGTVAIAAVTAVAVAEGAGRGLRQSRWVTKPGSEPTLPGFIFRPCLHCQTSGIGLCFS
jgi:hypothetical protein